MSYMKYLTLTALKVMAKVKVVGQTHSKGLRVTSDGMMQKTSSQRMYM